MIPLRGLVVCSGDFYASLLEITLPRNMRHLTHCHVITTPRDERVKRVVASVPGAVLYETDDFTAHGAKFNKGLCVERCFDFMGRHGWIVIWDADCLWPDTFPHDAIKPGHIHGCRRRLCEQPEQWDGSTQWGRFPVARDGGPVGFFQLFDAADPAIRDKRPWYDVSFAHAGGGDAYFITHWHPARHAILPMDVLHFGPRDTNWWGLDSESREIMTAYCVRNGWTRTRPGLRPGDVAHVPEIQERVEVPGYAKSTFEIPFVRRTKQIVSEQRQSAIRA